MNKMHTIQDVKQRIHELIQKEIAKCNKEIEEFEHKIRDNAIAYGRGGWCTQFEKAKKRREDFIGERRIYRANDGEVMKVARGSRQAKVNNHYIQLDSYGRFKD